MSFLLAEHRVLQSALASNIINTLGRFVMKAFKQDASHSVATLTCFIYGQVKSLWLYIAFEMTRSPLWSYIPDWPLWFQRVLAATHSTVVVRSVALSRKHLEGKKKHMRCTIFNCIYHKVLQKNSMRNSTTFFSCLLANYIETTQGWSAEAHR